MKLKEDKTYYSELFGCNIFLYKHHMMLDCQECGKLCKDPWSFTREDDDQHLEYVYGNDCIKKIRIKEIKEEKKNDFD